MAWIGDGDVYDREKLEFLECISRKYFSIIKGTLFCIQNNIENALTHEEIDQAAGVLFPFYDPESDVVYVAGKGDGSIRY